MDGETEIREINNLWCLKSCVKANETWQKWTSRPIWLRSSFDHLIQKCFMKGSMPCSSWIIIAFLIFDILSIAISHRLELWRWISSLSCKLLYSDLFFPWLWLHCQTLMAKFDSSREPKLPGSSPTKPGYMESRWFTVGSWHRNRRINWTVASIETCTKPIFTHDLCHLGQTTDHLSEAIDQTF